MMLRRRCLPIAGVFLIAFAVAPAGGEPVPTAVTVDCATDTLQIAIDAVPPGSTISVAPGVCHEDITIDKDLTLVGTAGESILDGVGWATVSVDGLAVVALDGLSITGGETGMVVREDATASLTSVLVYENGDPDLPDWDGGRSGLNNWGVLAITDSVIRDNWDSEEGGGIANYGDLTIRDSRIHDNHVYDSGGDGGGGGIFNGGTAVVTGSEITRNDAEEDSGGNVLNAGTMTIESSTISGGFAQESGGIENWADLTLHDVELRDNAGTVIGAIANREWLAWEGIVPHLVAERVKIVDNGRIDFLGYGGRSPVAGIMNHAGTMELRQSTIADNVGDCIGGIENLGTLLLVESRVSGNRSEAAGWCAPAYGGIVLGDGDTAIVGSEISGNESTSDGGGIYVGGGTVRIENSTISGNSAARAGGGVRNAGGNVTVVSSTIADNTAASFGGGTAGTIDVHSSIISGNSAPTGPQCRGVVQSSGWNVLGDATECNIRWIPSDLRNLDPKLGPLADNGGSTRTMRLRSGSPARDVIPPSLCAVTVDQRGVFRPQGAGCDIGAFEVEYDPPACTIEGTAGDDVLIGTSGPDVICGRGGDDEIRGRGGDDLIFGGGGKDTIFGGAGDDVIDGGNHGDWIYGNAGNDTVLGARGLDKVFGGPGVDIVDGGQHRDKVYGNGGADVLAAGTGHGNRLTGGDGADYLLGGAHRDRLIGGNQADRLEGYGGDDVLRGGNGSDTLDGGPGDDDVCGQAGDDVIIPSGGTDVTCPWG